MQKTNNNNNYFIIKKKRSPLRFFTETTILIIFWIYIVIDILIINSVLFKLRIPEIDSIIYYLAIDRTDARRLMYFSFFIMSACVFIALLCAIQRYVQRRFFDKKSKIIKQYY